MKQVPRFICTILLLTTSFVVYRTYLDFKTNGVLTEEDRSAQSKDLHFEPGMAPEEESAAVYGSETAAPKKSAQSKDLHFEPGMSPEEESAAVYGSETAAPKKAVDPAFPPVPPAAAPLQPQPAPQPAPLQPVPAPQPAPLQPVPAPQPAPLQPVPAPQPAPLQPVPAPQPAPLQPVPAPQPAPLQPVPAPQPAPLQPVPAPQPAPLQPVPAPQPAPLQPAPPPQPEPAPQPAAAVQPPPASSTVTLPPCVPGCGLPGVGLLSPTELTPTILYGLPGSGIVLFKYLLTTATRVVTGYIIDRLEKEIYTSDKRMLRVLAARTSVLPKETRENVPVSRSVLFVRNPYDAMAMQFIRDEYSDDETPLKRVSKLSKDWSAFVNQQTLDFEKMYIGWSKDRSPKHVVIYDRLANDASHELNDVIAFLNEPTIRPTVHCAAAEAEVTLAETKVPSWLSDLAVFTDAQRNRLNTAIDKVQQALTTATRQQFPEFQQWKRL